MEAMACGLPALVPNYSALGEWPKGAVEYVDINYNIPPRYNMAQVNTKFREPLLDSFIEKAELLYNDEKYRKNLGRKAYMHVISKEYEWSNIAKEFSNVFERVLANG